MARLAYGIGASVVVVLTFACGGKKDETKSSVAPLVTLPAPLNLTLNALADDEVKLNFDGSDGSAKQVVVSLKTNQIVGGDRVGPNDKFTSAFITLKGMPVCRLFVAPLASERTFIKDVADAEARKALPGTSVGGFKEWKKKEEGSGGWVVDRVTTGGTSGDERIFDAVRQAGGKAYNCSATQPATADGNKCVDAVAQACATLVSK